jgi:hypothetical protein
MSDSYTKLFRSITASTIVSEPVATRWFWVVLLSQADQNGCIYGSIPGMARFANLTVEEVEAALDTFYAPDPYSRTKDNEGRRVEEIDGGWHLLNHGKYKEIRSTEERREYMRKYMAERREREAAAKTCKQKSKLAVSNVSPTSTSTSSKSKAKTFVQQAARFEEFWKAYPARPGTSKKNKKGALAKWKARGLDEFADTILADIAVRIKTDEEWKKGFMQDPVTYLNQSRWEDDKPVAGAGSVASNPDGPSPKRETESPREKEENQARHDHHIGLIGAGELMNKLAEIKAKYGDKK